MKKISLLVFLGLIFSVNLFGEKIIFSAASMSGQTTDKNTTTKLIGNAFIQTEKMEISGSENIDYKNIIDASIGTAGDIINIVIYYKGDYLKW